MNNNDCIQDNPNEQTWENNNNKKIVVFLDLLGFSQATSKKESIDVALTKIQNFNEAINESIADYRSGCITGNFFYDIYITSFEYFIPASDSIFIVASEQNANLFVKQLSHFLMRSYDSLSEWFLKNDNINEEIHNYYIGWDEKTKKSVKYKQKISPCLFRGGGCVGTLLTTMQWRRMGNVDSRDSCNLFGEALTRAVKMEGWVTGPRILFAEDIYNLCSTAVKNKYFRQVPIEELKDEYKELKEKIYGQKPLYEILWLTPMFVNANIGGQPYWHNEAKRIIIEKLEGAYNLYSNKSNNGAKEHYLAFINLIRETSLNYWKNNYNDVETLIENWITQKEDFDLVDNKIVKKNKCLIHRIVKSILSFLHK